jgi:hypothetical protein
VANREKILVGLMAISQTIVVVGCNPLCQSERDLKLLWRESFSIAIEEVATPSGFSVSPSQAAKPIMARMSRPSWADAYLFVDGCNYYLGNGKKGEDIPKPLGCPYVISGNTGNIISGPQ